MTDRDPLATPTLARLYLAQGHFDRARAVLDACLRRDPFDGQALALVSRLQARSDATLGLLITGDRVGARWTSVHDATDCHIVIVASTQTGTTAATWVTSTRARTTFGKWECALPFARGTVSGCICGVDDRGWFVRAVARPVSWPE